MNQVANQNKNEVKPLDADAVAALILNGDLSKMSQPQKVEYYRNVCEMIGINPITKPFDYLTLSGKQVLYANKGCAEQLRKLYKISVKITDIKTISDIYIVTTEAVDAENRTDTSTGAVPIAGLKGESLANAFMKAETKSKRRVTLSICGLNMLDEIEADSIPGAHKEQANVTSQAAAEHDTRSVNSIKSFGGAPVIEAQGRPVPPPANDSPNFNDQAPPIDQHVPYDQFQAPPPKITPNPVDNREAYLGDYTVKVGKKYIGQKLKDMKPADIKSFCDWMDRDSQEKNRQLTGDWLELYNTGMEYLLVTGFIQ